MINKLEMKLSKKAKFIILLFLMVVFPYVSYFTFNTPVYIVAFYQYIDLQIFDQEPVIKKIGSHLYMCRSAEEMVAYFLDKGYTYSVKNETSYVFTADNEGEGINMYVQKNKGSYIIIFSLSKF